MQVNLTPDNMIELVCTANAVKERELEVEEEEEKDERRRRRELMSTMENDIGQKFLFGDQSLNDNFVTIIVEELSEEGRIIHESIGRRGGGGDVFQNR